MAAVTESELRATVERMERRWLCSPNPELAALVASYKDLAARFAADLQPSERDVLLAKASALMLIQEVARHTPTG